MFDYAFTLKWKATPEGDGVGPLGGETKASFEGTLHYADVASSSIESPAAPEYALGTGKPTAEAALKRLRDAVRLLEKEVNAAVRLFAADFKAKTL